MVIYIIPDGQNDLVIPSLFQSFAMAQSIDQLRAQIWNSQLNMNRPTFAYIKKIKENLQYYRYLPGHLV